ncbi:MAG: thioredoxin-disulfide reductase [Coprothermobacterota bacterium]|nr:thioredoxin-disulfide reductase [Coprothermobacterota bacterium]
MSPLHPLIIVGAGPAGYTAGLYAARGGLEALLIGLPGGTGIATDWVENYPALPEGISGFDLVDRMRQQAEAAGLHVEMAEVSRISLIGNAFSLETGAGPFTASAVIVATGAFPALLGVPGEVEFRGKGVSYCATCDGPLFRGKRLLVVGGGDSAVQEALFLAKLASQVTLVHRRDKLRATQCLQDLAFLTHNISIAWNSILLRIEGTNHVQSVVLKDVNSGQERSLEIDGVFLYVGLRPNSSLLSGLVNLDPIGAILTDEQMTTSVPGLFAAGDVRSTSLRQYITACADGAVAAISAIHFLQRHGSRK